MFRPHTDFCVCHNLKRLIVVRAGFCREGNEAQKKAKKGASGKQIPVGKWLKDRYRLKRKPTGERAMNLAIWAVRPHNCEVCLKRLGDIAKPIFFAHVLSKGAYPSFRLLDKNIVLMCEKHHTQFDCGDAKDPVFDEVNRRKQELKEKYYKT